MNNLMMEVFFKFYMGADRYKHRIVTLFFTITVLWGIYVYLCIYHLTFIQSLSYTFALFAVDAKAPNEISDAFGTEFTEAMVRNAGEWVQIYWVSVFAKITVLVTLFLVFIRKVLSGLYRKLIIGRGRHTIVVGLGRNGRFFINSILEDKAFPSHCLMAFETDKESPYLATYKNKKISVLTEDIDKMMNELNLEECENIFISTGSDEKNIYYALAFLDKLKAENKLKKLLVHIEDRTLRNFYSDEGALNSYAIVDMKVFSFYKESARMLFQEHALDGDDRDIIMGHKNFSINIVGDDDLSISMVVEACKLAHFPNENSLTINCIAKDILKLKAKVAYAFPEIEKIESVKINYFILNHESIEFYTHEVWNSENLKHVFYCYDDVALNIRIETKVRNVTYLRKRDKAENIKFYIATMNHIKIAKELERSIRKNLFMFACSDKVCGYENLLDNEIDTIARWSNYAYYKENIGGSKDSETLWKETLINDKKSTVGQVIHMQTKLKFLGLEVCDKSKISQKELSEANNKVIFKALTIQNINDLMYSKETDKKLNKLAKSEHNRWMALLMLMDYIYTNKSKKDKIQKEHPLLKPLSEFSDEELTEYTKYDTNSILKIAEYMAKLGKGLRESSLSKRDNV
jgi:hypothetical protein